MTNTKQTVLTKDELDKFVGEIVEYGTDFVAPLYSIVEAIESAVLSKLRAAGEPSDEELLKWAGEEQFFLFCDEDDFLQIARALLSRYAAPQASAEARNAALEEAANAVSRVPTSIVAFTSGYPIPRPESRSAAAAIAEAIDAIRALRSAPAAESTAAKDGGDGKTRVVGEHLTGGCLNWDYGEDSAKGAGDAVYIDDCGSPEYLDGIECQYAIRRKTGPGAFDYEVLAYVFDKADADLVRDALADRQQRGGDVGEHGAFWWRKGLRATLAPQPAASVHPIPQRLREAFSAIEDSAHSANGMQVFTQMRTAVQSFFQAQPAASAEPSVHEINREMTNAGWQNSGIRQADLPKVARVVRALLSRYGRPAGDVQPVAWTTPDGREPISDAVKRARPDLYDKAYTVALSKYSAPVAAQKANDADPLQGAADWLVKSLAKPRPSEIAARLLIGYNRAERLYNAAIAQQRQGEGGE